MKDFPQRNLHSPLPSLPYCIKYRLPAYAGRPMTCIKDNVPDSPYKVNKNKSDVP